jgi:hypothetical protein
VPTFVLNNVQDFDVHQSRPVPSQYLDRVEQKTL